MKSLKLAWLTLGLLLVATGLAAQEFTGKAADAIVPGAAMVLMEEGSELPLMIRFRDDARIPLTEFTGWEKETIGFGNEIRFESDEPETSKYGQVHQVRHQFVRDISVQGGRSTVHSKDGYVYAINYNGIVSFDKSTSPLISKSVAESKAFEHLEIDEKEWRQLYFALNYTIVDTEIDLNYLEGIKSNLIFSQEANDFVWEVVFTSHNFEKDVTMLLSANTLQLIEEHSNVKNCNGGFAQTTWRGTRSDFFTDVSNGDFILLNDCGGRQIRTRAQFPVNDFTSPINNWFSLNSETQGAVTAHWSMGQVYNYFNNTFGRNGYDGSGVIEVRINNGFPGAQFNFGNYIILGLGNIVNVDSDDLTTIEVCGHEFTHGFLIDEGINPTSNNLETGSLGEGICDIFGNNAEWDFEGFEESDWVFGGDISNASTRFFEEPNNDTDGNGNITPGVDTYLGDFWPGGIHANGGVIRKWMNLVSVGGIGTNDNFDDYLIDGIGIDIASEILYNAIDNGRFGVNPNFAQARTATLEEARDMGFDECTFIFDQIYKAWLAVGVGAVLLPDLIMDNITSSLNGNNQVEQGETFDVSFDITAIDTTFSSYVGFYLRSWCNSALTSPFQVVATPGVNCGETDQLTVTVTLPTGINPGNYTLVAIIDPFNDFNETLESNNHDCIQLSIQDPDPLPDFVSTACVNPGSVEVGESFTAGITLRNEGTAYGDYTRMGYYLSADQDYDGTTVDRFLGTRHFGGLIAGGEFSGNKTLVIPEDIIPGNYYILYRADTYGWRSESNENNNLLACAITVTPPPANLPDLRITSVNPGPDFGSPPTVASGQTLTVSYDLINAGTGPVSDTNTKIYISTDQTPDISEIVDTRYFQQPGTHQFNIRIPKGANSGFYYILIEADYNEQVSESIETNNISYGFFQVNGFSGLASPGGQSATIASQANAGLSESQSLSSNGKALGALDIVLYPNPTSNLVNLSYAIQPAHSLSIQLRTITGRMVVNQEFSSKEQTGQWKYEVSHLPPGIYQLTVASNDQVTTKKLVIR